MRLSTASIFLLAVALASCGGSSGTQTTTYNGTTYTKTGNTVTVQNKEGKMTVTQGVNAADLGAPVYPGATPKEDAAGSITSKAGTISAATFTTGDSFHKVYEWYKARMPKGSETMKTESGGTALAQFGMGNQKNATSVTIMQDQNKQVTISITHTK